LAWAGIADCHGQMLIYSVGKDAAETARIGLEAARRAIAIDPRLAEAHKAEALVLRYSGDIPASTAALKRALDVNPRFVPALTNLAGDYFARANLAAAERLLRRALEVDPQQEFSLTWLMMLLTQTGRLDESREVMNRGERLAQGNSFFAT